MDEQRLSQVEGRVEALHWKVDEIKGQVKDIHGIVQQMAEHYGRLDERIPSAPTRRQTTVVATLAAALSTAATLILQRLGIPH
ncbi:hypothetical protein [Nitrolancea hollandica]|uniref:Uncharacterized protein n=1 Tax=Nitrolancea hollandica Lb TaxID=1129897 RepID=I4EL42_9BACT|nr:hypothetical protein [Nitrolancea hollandica]CCF85404.1 hypothetical protein NITHO_4920015 [Nitrolancea hollandica Lb]